MTIEPIVMVFELRSRSLSRDTSLLTSLIARVVPATARVQWCARSYEPCPQTCRYECRRLHVRSRYAPATSQLAGSLPVTNATNASRPKMTRSYKDYRTE